MASSDAAMTESAAYSPEDLKRDLATELDKVGNNREATDEEALRGTLRRWVQSSSESLPNALLYPVERYLTGTVDGPNCDPYNDGLKQTGEGKAAGIFLLWHIEEGLRGGRNSQRLGLRTMNKRAQAVMELLRKLSRDEDFEVFLTQPSGARSSRAGEHAVSGSGRNYVDAAGQVLFTDFTIPRQDILRSAHADCDEAIVISPSRRLLGELLRKTGQDDPRSDIARYLLHRAVDRDTFDLAACLHDYTSRINYDINGTWPWPVQVVERLLIVDMLFARADAFNDNASAYPREPPSRFFGQLSTALRCTEQRGTLGYYAGGLDVLLGKVSHRDLADALSYLEDPEEVAANPKGYVARWIDAHFEDITIRSKVKRPVGVEEAKAVVNTCMRFQKGFQRGTQLELMFLTQASNSRFCVALALQILIRLQYGDVAEATARSWYQYFRYDGIEHIAAEAITTLEAWDMFQAFSQMIKRGWQEEAAEFLVKLVLGNMDAKDPARAWRSFHRLWLPFFACTIGAYQDQDCPAWQDIEPIFRNILLGGVVLYAVAVIGREPKKNVLRREKLRRTRHCPSCETVSSFLVDGQKARQVFQIARSPRTDHSQYRVSSSALRHVTRRLARRDCDFHVCETRAAGPVLVLQKIGNDREWQEWKAREDTGRRELMKVFMTEYFQDVVGSEARREEWYELGFLRRGHPELSIPFVMEHPHPDVKKTLLYVKYSATTKAPGFWHEVLRFTIPGQPPEN